jgi:dipeptidyl aminopeptidase/acylaminoacyl peptidase
MPAKLGMQPADVADLIEVGSPRLSPDGRTVAFVVTTVDTEANDYRSRIWLGPVNGSAPPRPFTAGEGRDTIPAWSPDGRWLAFASKVGEDARLKVIAVDGRGEARTVATSKEDFQNAAWSPDGERLAYSVRVRDARYDHDKPKDQPARRIDRFFFRLENVGWTIDRPAHIFTVDVARDAAPVQLTFGDSDDHGLSWSPDGRAIAFAGSRHADWDIDRAEDLFSIGVDSPGAEPRRLTETAMTYSSPSWSPDGGRVAFLFGGDPLVAPTHSQVGVLDLGTGEVALLTTDLDRQCAPFVAGARQPLWVGDDLLFGVEDAGDTHVYRVAADGKGKPERVTTGERCVTGWDAAGGVVAFTAGTATTFTELYVIDPDGAERRLTELGSAFAAKRAIAAPERFNAVSADGAEVDAWMIRPVGFQPGQRYPMLLNIHGGPFTQYANRFFDEFQVEAAAGYAVVYANPRGSSGYSQAWGRAIRGPRAEPDPGSGWGGVDYDDLMAVTDEAVARFDFVDPDRLGVMGGSYGGYMTSWIIGHTSRFKAACSERAVNNLLTMEHTSDIATVFEDYVGARHLDDPDEYRRQSPITYVRDIDTPVLIIHSELDLRCPIEQSEELFIALRLLGKDVEYVRFPGESHELTRGGAPRHRVERFEILLDYFARHL